MKKKYYLSGLIFFLLIINSFSQEIVSYSSINNAGCSGIIAVDANVTANGVCRGVGINQNGGATYNSRDWTLGAVIDANDYLEWALTPNIGYQLDLTTMDIRYDRSPTGPSMVEIQVDSGTGFITVFSDAAVAQAGENNNGIDLTAFTGITGTITFRLYAYNASNTNGTFDIEENALNDKGIIINGLVTPGCSFVTTWDGATWTPALPDNTYGVVIDAPYNTLTDGGSFDACSLTVNADLNISGTDYVQVTNDVTINNGNINVASEANLVQISDASTVTLAGTGVGVVQKTTTPLQAYYSYTYWSSPFVNETIGEAASGLDLVPANRIFEYDASNFEDVAPADGFDDNSDDWAIASGAMIPGRGYAAFAQSSAMAFPQTQTFNFDGEFNNGVVTTPITISVGAADPNWNLIGNPYPSALSADTFLTDPANTSLLGGTIYLWTHSSAPLGANPGPDNLNFSVDDYASYTPGTGGVAAVNAGAGGTVPTGAIASGQGFFIEATAAGVATFNNNMRATTGNDNFFRATDRIWLNLENDYDAFSQILIGFAEGATNGVDRLYDGKRLDAGSYISFFSLIEDEHYAIQGRELLGEEEIIPLGIKNLVSGVNEYKISIENVEGLLETAEVLLNDNLLNITHDLNSGVYVFNSEEGVFKERFELVLRTEALSIDDFSNTLSEELLIIKNQNNSISFTTTRGSQIQNIQIFDVLGRQLYDFNINEGQQTTFKLSELEQTIFIAKATLGNGKVLTKKGLK